MLDWRMQEIRHCRTRNFSTRILSREEILVLGQFKRKIDGFSWFYQLLPPLKGGSLQIGTDSSIHDWLVDRQPACNRYAFLGTKQDAFRQGSCCSIGTCWLC